MFGAYVVVALIGVVLFGSVFSPIAYYCFDDAESCARLACAVVLALIAALMIVAVKVRAYLESKEEE